MNYSILTTWLACCLLVVAQGFTHQININNNKPSASHVRTAFVGQSCQKPSKASPSQRPALVKMDLEEPFSSSSAKEILKRYNIPMPVLKTHLQIPKTVTTTTKTTTDEKAIDDALAKHGLPWKTSIDPTYQPVEADKGLFYMPFFEWQIQFMKDNLTNVRVLPTESKTGVDLSYIENAERPVRMVTLCFASDEYRKIRMTVYDAGNRTQVFTSLWYPDPQYNLPVLGIDLLQFNKDRHLCVVDFQPIQSTESQHAQTYEHLLQPIRNQYPSLQGQMTKRFYDENQYFSNQMLYSRFEELHDKKTPPANLEDHPAYHDLFPAYKQYVQTHLNLVRSTTPQPKDTAQVMQGQAAYDTYSADRDPAHAMFGKVFGSEFADAFVYDVLFSYSEGDARLQAGAAAAAQHQQQQQQQQ